MDPTTLVVAAYGAARDRGEARTEAFLKAVRAYCVRHPDFPAERAGAEVARLLLDAARAADIGRGDVLPAAMEMEYVEPA